MMQKALSLTLVIPALLLMFLPANAKEDRGRGYFDLGVFAYEEGDYTNAERYLKKALELNRDNPYYNHYMGKTYLKTEEYRAAEEYLSTAWQLDPDISGLKYDRAMLNYKTFRYPAATDLFTEIADEDPSNVLAQYHAGISLMKQEKYDQALERLLAAAAVSPTIKVNGYYYAGVCYWKMGQADQAVEKFQYVRDHAESELLRENALAWIGKIEEEKGVRKPYSLYLRVGYGYDSNVTLDPLDEDVFSDEDDYYTSVHFSGKYNVVNRKDWVVGAGYSHYQSWYNDLEEYDLTGSLFRVYARYRLRPFVLGLSYLPSYYWLDQDSYLRRHMVKPEVIWEWKDTLSTVLSYAYSDNEYFQDESWSGDRHGGYLDTYYSILDKAGYLFAGIGYEKNDASNPDQDYGWFKTKAGVLFHLPWKTELDIRGQYQSKQYDNVDRFFGIEREDDKYCGAVSVARELFYQWLAITAEFNYTKNESNITEYEYDKYVGALYLRAQY
jgi:tetratricopeptide (TPR) repeat protein